MDNLILTAKFELKEGNHIYSFDPKGFNKRVDGISPVFSLDNKTISIYENLSDSYENCAYLVCGCKDYKKREKRFENEEKYKKLQNNPDFVWDCIATCQHITLVKKYFVKPLMEKVLEEIANHKSNPIKVAAEFLGSREGGFFPRTTLRVSAEYLKQHNL